MIDIFWQLLPRDPLAQVLIGVAIGSIIGLVIVIKLRLLDLPLTWRGP